MCAKKRQLKRGAVLIELITAAGITVLVLGGAVSTLFVGSAAWARGMGKIGAEVDSQMAVRIVAQQLREAMSVKVDADGKGLTYRVPQTDKSGAYTLPISWDGRVRSVRVQKDKLVLADGQSNRVIASGLVFSDPVSKNGNQPYRIFTPGPGTVTRQVTIQIATSRYGVGAKKVASRSRETIFLRNIPQLTQ